MSNKRNIKGVGSKRWGHMCRSDSEALSSLKHMGNNNTSVTIREAFSLVLAFSKQQVVGLRGSSFQSADVKN